MSIKSVLYGMTGAGLLLLVYFAVITFVSGWELAHYQFSQSWYFVLSLAVGFGVQIGLYTHLRKIVHRDGAKGAVVASGATSTVAMVSCCAHYAANILPIIGVTGAMTLIGQYQIELFWVGLASNALGIAYIARRLIRFTQQQ